MRKNLVLQTRCGPGAPKLVSDLYDPRIASLRLLLDDAYFPDETFETSRCLKFLTSCGLRTCLSSDLCKMLMSEIEIKVSQEKEESPEEDKVTAERGWTDALRTRSKMLYMHLVENVGSFDASVWDHRFMEPHCPSEAFVRLGAPFEFAEFDKTCIKLGDAELQSYESLVWTSSFVLPDFVRAETLNASTLERLPWLSRRPSFGTVIQHLVNLSTSLNGKEIEMNDELERVLVKTLVTIYGFLDELSANEKVKWCLFYIHRCVIELVIELV